ncbi:MAG: putative Ig domain-containing protein [Fretibacterium sp.]|nr:putative Ig domain-containing protein [Fretibacterium sp.]
MNGVPHTVFKVVGVETEGSKPLTGESVANFNEFIKEFEFYKNSTENYIVDEEIVGLDQLGYSRNVESPTIGAVEPLGVKILTASLPNGQAGEAYSATVDMDAAGGALVRELSGLPAGLTFDPATGAVSGTPEGSGIYTLTATATAREGGSQNSTSKELTLIIAPSVAAPASMTLTAGTNYTAEKAVFSVSSLSVNNFSNADYTWAVEKADIPGMSAEFTTTPGELILSGTPTSADDYTLTVKVTAPAGDGGLSSTADLRVIVNPADVKITASLKNGSMGNFFSESTALTVDPAGLNYTWSITSAPDNGLNYSIKDGTLSASGTPNKLGGFDLSVTAASPGGTGTATLTHTIILLSSDIKITPASVTLPSGTAGKEYTAAATFTISPEANYQWSVSGLPAGLSGSFSANALTITGTPQASGNFVAAATAKAAGGETTARLDIDITARTALDVENSSASNLQQLIDNAGRYELDKIESLSFRGGGNLTSLSGLAAFPNLKELRITGCENLTELDASGCEKLEVLDCSGNALTSLKLDGCEGLTELDCSGNGLVELDLSTCEGLRKLDCSGNELARLDVSACVNLERLDCSGNKLTVLNLSGCADLTSLDCSANALPKLDLSDCVSLETLDCSDNQLAALALEENTALTTVDYSGQARPNGLTVSTTGVDSVVHLSSFVESSLGALDRVDQVLWNGSTPAVSYDGTTGVAVFADGTAPTSITYRYDTKAPAEAALAGGEAMMVTLRGEVSVGKYSVTITSSMGDQSTQEGSSYNDPLWVSTVPSGLDVRWEAEGLPEGLTIGNLDGDRYLGQISGHPTPVGTYLITVRATASKDGVSFSDTRTFTLTVNPAVTITTTSLPPAIRGLEYSTLLEADVAGDSGRSMKWLVRGSDRLISKEKGLLSLSETTLSGKTSTTVLGGKPLYAGIYTVHVEAQLTNGGVLCVDSRDLELEVKDITVSPAQVVLPDATVGQEYSATQALSVAPEGMTYEWVLGGVPEGMTCKISGDVFSISGRPTANRTFLIYAWAAVEGESSNEAVLSLTVNPAEVSVTQASLNPSSATAGEAYSGQMSLAASPAGLSYAWSVSGLPGGLTFDPVTHTITGTPAEAGTYPLVVTATGGGGVGKKTVTFAIKSPSGGEAGGGLSLAVDASAGSVSEFVSNLGEALAKEVTKLEVSANENITEVDLSGSELPSLTELNVRDCPNLTAVNASGNESLKSLNVSGCEALETVDAKGSPVLEKVDASGSENLKTLDVSDCGALTELKAADCESLTELKANDCGALESLDVSGCTNLTELDVSSNKLGELNVRECKSLTSLKCSTNKLTSLKGLDDCRQLQELFCQGNGLAALFVPRSLFPYLTRLDCGGQKRSDLSFQRQGDVFQVRIGAYTRASVVAAEGAGTVRIAGLARLSASDFDNVTGVVGYNSAGGEIAVIYDVETGVASFASAPAAVTYQYRTGFEEDGAEVLMDVSLTQGAPADEDRDGGENSDVSSNNDGGGCAAGLPTLALLLLPVLARKRG